MSEPWWAVFCLLIGGFQATANVATTVFVVGARGARLVAAGLAGLLFGLPFFLGVALHPTSLFGAFCGVQMVVQAIVCLRLWVDR